MRISNSMQPRVWVCIGLAALAGVSCVIGGQPVLEVDVVGTDMDNRVFLVKPNIGGLFLLRKPCSHKLSFLRAMKLKETARKVEDGIEETLTYCDFPGEHWTRIRTNNVIERLNREIRRRTRVVGTFPDGISALMLVCARLRHVAGTQWGCKKYMNMKHLEVIEQDLLVG